MTSSPHNHPDSSFAPLVVVVPDDRGRIDAGWLQRLGETLPGRFAVPRGAGGDTGLDELDADTRHLPALAAAAAGRAGRDGALVLESGLEPPPHFATRLADLARAAGCPALTLFAGNHDPQTNPAAGLDHIPDAAWCDAVAHAAGERRWMPVDHTSARCLYLAATDPGRIHGLIETGHGWLFDGLFIHDPGRDPAAGEADKPACRAALGPLRLALQRLLADDDHTAPGLFGCDDKPVTLHISHDWGGGVARWIGDIIEADTGGHHLVLAAGGKGNGEVHGQRLRLYAAGPGRAPIGEWVLTPAIAGTDMVHAQYASVVQTLVERFGVGRVIVSSLIGHSLEVFHTGLPTLQVLHDYYPAWPVLDHDPLEFDTEEGPDLQRAIDTHADEFLFADRDARHWRALAEQWQRHVTEHDVALIAPTAQVLERWQRLCGDFVDRARIVPHGFDGWSDPVPEIRPRKLADGRLNLVVVGRLSPGKGLGLLEKALPRLRALAHVTLLGCGHHGMRLFGRPGVDIVLNYHADELPRMLAGLQPQAALFLSTVAETWNYVLSETRSLGLVPVATRTGSFVERIDHGRDGVLFEPDADSLVATIRELHEHPERLEALADHLPQEPTMHDALAACDELVPARTRTLAPPEMAGSGSVRAAGLAFDLADARQRADKLDARTGQLRRELAERAAWARKYERLTQERTRWARRQEKDLAAREQELDEQGARLEAQQDEIDRAIAQLRDYEATIAERTEWAQSLDRELTMARERIGRLEDELATVYASRSWRVTRPMRFFNRVLVTARQRMAYNPLRWPRMAIRALHNLRVYGLRGTLDLMQQGEATIPEPPTPQASAPEPNDRPEPVRLDTSDRPRISILIPVFNKVEYTAACLDSISEHTSGEFEVIVVDDCSGEETVTYLERCEGIRVIRNETNAGFIASCNRGAAAARGEFLVFLNNDTTVTRDWLEALIDTFELFPDTGAVGARLVYPDGTLQEAGGIVFNDGSGWNYGRGERAELPQYNFASEADYVSGACLAIRREVFARLDGFDSHYAPAYYEDTDLCFRLREHGLRVICQPACTIIHHEGVSSGTDESTGIKRYQRVNREKFIERWRETLAHQPPPVPGPEAVEQVRRARHFRSRGHMLVIDAITPEPDKDSGSVRMQALLEICRDLGYRVSFMPENLAWVERYTRNLQRRGIEVLYRPGIESPEAWLGEHGRALDMVIGSRHYVLAPMLALIRKHCPAATVVFDTVDLHFLREERKAELTGDETARRTARRTRKAELDLMRSVDVTLVVSPVEQELLGELLPGADIRVLSNIHTIHGRRREWSQRRDLLFVGGFQHPPNIDAAEWLIEEIFPAVRAQIPDIGLHIIGSRMPEHLRERRAPGVTIHGFVENLEPFLEGCRLSVAPLRYGAGVKGKVNQAMAWGLPVVATSCAAEGMFLTHGEDVLIADSSEDFAEQIVRAYNDETLWSTLSDGGLENVERYFSYNAARRAIGDLVKGSRADTGDTEHKTL